MEWKILSQAFGPGHYLFPKPFLPLFRTKDGTKLVSLLEPSALSLFNHPFILLLCPRDRSVPFSLLVCRWYLDRAVSYLVDVVSVGSPAEVLSFHLEESLGEMLWPESQLVHDSRKTD